MLTPVATTELARFLHAAKSATYAAQGDEASVFPALADTRQLEFRDGRFFYRDVYAGMFRFAGQEIVYFAERAVWSMSYAGGLVAGTERSSARPIYAFLRRALLAAPVDCPLRGPESLEAEGLRYACRVTGSLEQFRGTETIFRNGVGVYELGFAGGRLE